MSPMLGLRSLPPELRALILESLASPADLFSLITTSKQYYDTFLRIPEHILAHVIRNAFGTNLQHALGAFYASRQTQETERTREVVESLLDDYHNDRLELPTSLADLSQLSRMFVTIQRLILDYSVRSTELLTGKAHVILLPWSHPSYQKTLREHPLSLSATEETRLRRAFLRFDMYCHCFPLVGLRRRPNSQLFFRGDQSALFLSRLDRWEVEEICCAHQYMYTVAEMAVRDVENDFVDEVLDTSKEHFRTRLPHESSSTEASESSRDTSPSSREVSQSSHRLGNSVPPRTRTLIIRRYLLKRRCPLKSLQQTRLALVAAYLLRMSPMQKLPKSRSISATTCLPTTRTSRKRLLRLRSRIWHSSG